jgi:hypothetical protein
LSESWKAPVRTPKLRLEVIIPFWSIMIAAMIAGLVLNRLEITGAAFVLSIIGTALECFFEVRKPKLRPKIIIPLWLFMIAVMIAGLVLDRLEITGAAFVLSIIGTALEYLFEVIDVDMPPTDAEIRQMQASSVGVSTDGSRTLTCPHCGGVGYYEPQDVDEQGLIMCRYCLKPFSSPQRYET